MEALSNEDVVMEEDWEKRLDAAAQRDESGRHKVRTSLKSQGHFFGRFAALNFFEEPYDISIDWVKDRSEDAKDFGVAGRSENHVRLFTTHEGIWATKICRHREGTTLANGLVTLC